MMNRYFTDIKELKTSTLDSKIYSLAKQGDIKARNKIVEKYLLLVVKIAKKYANMGVSLEDLIAEGNLGLIKAIEKYDPIRGDFYNCAYLWIRASILRNAINNKHLIRVPESVLNKARSKNKSIKSHISLEDLNLDLCYVDDDKNNNIEHIINVLNRLDDRSKDLVMTYINDKTKLEDTSSKYKITKTRAYQIIKKSFKKIKEDVKCIS